MRVPLRALRAALPVLLLVGTAAAPASAAPAFAVPAVGGVAPLGSVVAYELLGCDDDVVRAVVSLTGDRSLPGPEVAGCSGTVRTPSAEDLASAGVDESEVVGLRLVADGGGTVELHPQRAEAEHVTDLPAETAADPLGGGASVAVPAGGTTVPLGTVDLTKISSLSIRYATPAGGGYACVLLICATAVAELLADGAVVGSQELAPTGGWETWQRAVMPVGGSGTLMPVPAPHLFEVPEGSVDLALRLRPVAPACPGGGASIPFVAGCAADARLLRLNFLDLNGQGVSRPYEAPADPEGTVVLFDGDPEDPFAGWTLSGGNCFPGTPACLPEAGNGDRPGMEYVEAERAMRTDGVFGLLWYSAQSFADYTLRLEFKVEHLADNGGVYVRFPAVRDGADGWDANGQAQEFQIQDVGYAYPQYADASQTGSAYALTPSDRIATNAVGDWNTYEVEVRGQQYTVRINGRTVTEFTPPAEGDVRGRHDVGHVGLQIHDPAGHVWYRDVRVIPHHGDPA